ncbi:hypothetical protein CFC21_064190 [Triticum aestivum]|uniref:Uncharacterized protein n=3 Tax=Triticum TaxID=4564 RepID=A0A9R0TFG8_TRITD|nr:hypothetical protein CFC21_064190 [Triticum aestivum]VAI12948.1 unnamed protein product [Triticum turgidum subsp. durum]
MTSLLRDLGANPTVVELNEDPRGKEMEKALARLIGRNLTCRRCSSAAGSSDAPTRSCPFISAASLSHSFVMQVLSGTACEGFVDIRPDALGAREVCVRALLSFSMMETKETMQRACQGSRRWRSSFGVMMASMAEEQPRLSPQSALKMDQWKMVATTHVYIKRENAGSWNSGLDKEQILETYSAQLQKS